MNSETEPIPIRAHTLLCLQGFQGAGYSPEFVNEMTRIWFVLKQNPEQNVKVIVGADNFCQVCPHHSFGRCTAGDPENTAVHPEAPDQMILQDKRVLQWLGLTENEIYSWREIVVRIGESVDSTSMDILCGNCSWRKFPYCETALDSLHNKVTSHGDPFSIEVPISSDTTESSDQ